MLGWLSVLVGYVFALLLIRGILLGIMRGFRTAPSHALWLIGGYLVFFGLAMYLIAVGRRALSIAQGNPPLKGRFGWGRIVLGTVVLYSNLIERFHLLPMNAVYHIRHFEPANATEAASMNFTAIVIDLVCVALIFSGIWRGFRLRGIATERSNIQAFPPV